MPLYVILPLVVLLFVVYIVACIWAEKDDELRRRERRMRDLQRAGQEYSRNYRRYGALLRRHDLRRQLQDIREEDARIMAELALLEDRMREPLEKINWDWKQEGF
jgi:hypothetical protein